MFELVEKLLDTSKGSSDLNIHSTLKLVRGKIKEWLRKDKNNIDVKIKDVEKCIEDVDRGTRGNHE